MCYQFLKVHAPFFGLEWFEYKAREKRKAEAYSDTRGFALFEATQ